MAKPYTFKMKLKHLAVACIMKMFGILPKSPNKIVFCSYFGKGYGDNGKAITEALLKINPNLDIVWGVSSQFMASLPDTVRGVEYNSLKYLKELATAVAWVDNSRKNAGVRKRKGQFYVQTWHGTVALKQIENDAACNLDEFYVAGAKNDSKMADVILSGCKFFTDLCKRSFWYNGEILECGSPRSDALFNTDNTKKSEVKKALGIPDGKKIILYAPTFRADEQLECYNMDFNAVLDALEKKTGDSWVFAVRLHPNVCEKADFITYSDRIFNATVYNDLYELIPTVDFVISDYSSVMFDAALVDKPVMLFATDVKEYIADRNFYFDIRKLPFGLAESNDELINNIKTFDRDKYDICVKEFNSKVGYFENGTAAKAVAERIMTEIND